jgi:glycosyltransferase involved in cell wall biosynthesis
MSVVRSHDVALKLSVVMAVYNAEQYLVEAVESVLAQTFGDFELLALDDGSTDSSLQILKNYETKDPRIRVLTRENKGIARTRAELTEHARGKYIAIMDSDDISRSDRLQKQIEFLDANVDCVAVGSWVMQINAKGQPIRILDYPRSHKEIDERNLEGRTAIVNPTAMIRRQAVLTAGTYGSECKFGAEDLDLWLRLAEVGKLANIPMPLLKYRLHKASLSETHLNEQFAQARRVCENAWRRRGIKREFKAEKHWRTAADPSTRHKILVQYAWIAWSNGYRATWWTYVCEALYLRPFALSSWRLLFFGLVRSPKKDAEEGI